MASLVAHEQYALRPELVACSSGSAEKSAEARDFFSYSKYMRRM